MRPVFVGGCQRSGTTFLGALLGDRDGTVCVPEMPFKTQLLRRLPWDEGPVPSERVAGLLGRRAKARAWGLRWDDPKGPFPPGRRFTYRKAVEAAVEAYAAAHGRPGPGVWIDHTPWNIRLVQELLGAFPDAAFVHLVRDGRGVAASLLRCDWGPDTILGLTRYWPTWVAFGLAAEEHFPARVHRVRYEDLVRSPETTLRHLGEQLELPTPGLHGMGAFEVPRHTREQHRLVGQPPDPSRADAWQRELAPRDIEVIEHELGELLEHLGYVRVAPRPTRRPRWRYRIRDGGRTVARPFRRLREALRFRLAYRSRPNPGRDDDEPPATPASGTA